MRIGDRRVSRIVFLIIEHTASLHIYINYEWARPPSPPARLPVFVCTVLDHTAALIRAVHNVFTRKSLTGKWWLRMSVLENKEGYAVTVPI